MMEMMEMHIIDYYITTHNDSTTARRFFSLSLFFLFDFISFNLIWPSLLALIFFLLVSISLSFSS